MYGLRVGWAEQSPTSPKAWLAEMQGPRLERRAMQAANQARGREEHMNKHILPAIAGSVQAAAPAIRIQ